MFGRSKTQDREPPREDAAVGALQRLWQTKRHNILLLEQWLGETADTEIRAALPRQVIDERLHLRLIGERIRALGGRINPEGQGEWLDYALNIGGGDATDLHRLVALYRGTKTYSVTRCRRLVGSGVDKATEAVIVRLVLDEERQIRWAEMRIDRLWTGDKARDCNFVLERIHRSLEAAWERPARRLALAAANQRNIA